MVELAMSHPGSRGHALNVAIMQYRAGAHAVLVFERTVEYIGDDFHVSVPVGTEALGRLHAILVDH